MIIKMNDEFEARMMLSDKKAFKEFKENNLGVVGSRTFWDEGFMTYVLNILRPNRVISGGAKGADTLAENWARKGGVPCDVHYPDLIRWPWDRFKGKAYLERNDIIATMCDALVAFVPINAKSSGTMYTVGKAAGLKKPVLLLYF
jgi:predicted Rossmann fold nucleotide-binding protein DprA/Smf involved in DNA uptake